MRVPLGWLKTFVDVPGDAHAIAARLGMLGFPVEAIETRPAISGVVIGKIVTLEKHPNADSLQVASVDVGEPETLTIQTAATNVAAGQTIAVARVGAQLPSIKIEKRKMRGIVSEGMMISGEELALPGDWFEDGIMQFEADRPLGTDVVAEFSLNDAVLDVEVTSNRVDAMSILGIARELAASYDLPLRLPSFDNPGTREELPGETPVVEIQSPDCARFVAQRFDGIRVEPAPAWMRIRLALAGQRPISNLVDVSNYVMLEVGQPLHFYDAARIHGGKLFVRDGHDGEKTVTLDDVERTLDARSLVIADDRETLCLAGLMGAEAGEVREATTAIVLEAANFNGARVRRMSQLLGLRSEASSRHEKTLAPAMTDLGAARAAHILQQLGATAYRPHAYGAALENAPPIELRTGEVARLLGLTLSRERIAQHLSALGCAVGGDEATLSVVPPAWRRDLVANVDLIEEVARMEGYDRVPSSVPSVAAHEISSAVYECENAVARTIASLGYNEIVTYSLNGGYREQAMKAGLAPSRSAVAVLNPLSEEQRFLRHALTPGLLEYFARIDAPVRAFEIGHTFAHEDNHINETATASFGFTAEPLDEPAWRDSHFLRLKGDCETFLRAITGRTPTALPDVRNGLHPGKTAMMMIDGREAAYLGRTDPRLQRAFDVRLPVYLCTIYIDALPDHATPRYKPPSKFPSTYRDLALVVAIDVGAAEIENAVARALGSLCTGVRAFDEYRGPQVPEGQKSVALRATLARTDATITDEEADDAVKRALAVVRDEIGATIRE